ncbi:transglutaminase TgpA family protein [Bradymonas sediminis]|uniref:Uncharacterized protein n=1 Tax=Bradymonas sediminis TaxID=1548548 RepID=A0A2Z4FLJ4_9DELT|nr:DUF3488 and transglutaminase-like domain-containing protein [Bradymonas sediminis]AWV89675.1 hypothetical protein DN745_10120 [Bradymonas sediminis]TDP76584.1 transglutaminase-like putative cysteine protease [Bradymonas sediminis]
MNLKMQQHLAGLHKGGIYAVVLIAFLCAAFGGGVGALTGAGFIIATLASWFTSKNKPADATPSRWWNVVTLGFIAFTAFQLLATSEPIIVAALRFVLVLIAIKLFGRFRTRDDLQIYALTLLVFAASTALSQDIVYGLFFGLYVIAGTFSMALFHLNSEVNPDEKSAQRVQISSSSRSPFDRRYMLVLGAISLVIFVSSLTIFFVFPRVGLGFFVNKSRDSMSVTGFSDSVELGSHGAIRDNPEVVMRAEFPDGRPENYQSLHWRTMTFDHYNGATWSQSVDDSERSLPTAKKGYQFTPIQTEKWKPAAAGGPAQQVDIYLEPLGVNLLPRLWPTGNVRYGNNALMVSWNPLKGGFTIDAYSDLRHTLESEVGVAYSIQQLTLPNAEELRGQTYETEQRRPDAQYLQLPNLSQDFLSLAEQVSRGAETPYEKAEAIVAHLSTSYGYTTDLPPVRDDEPIESFVFDTKQGHCEYFASTAVLMLRARGVHARLVTGFLGGAWNSMGGYLGVRQGDAHAWAEVYVPNYGWVPIDPTPAADVLPVQRGPMETWLRNAYDAARLNWMKWVIEYDLGAQIALAQKAAKFFGSGARSNPDSPQKSDDKSKSDLNLGALAYGIILLAALAILVWLSRRWLFRTQASKLQEIFARVERAGASAGVERRADEGPGVYLERLSQAFPDAAPELAALRQRYLTARFGGREPGPMQLAGMRELVAALRKKLPRKPRDSGR